MILEEIAPLIQGSSYFFLFIILLLEGPIIGFIASFSASQGFLNIFLVAIVYFLGDLTGDVIHYWLGFLLRSTHNKFFKKRFKFLSKKTNSEKMKKIHKLMEKKLFLSLAIIKLTPPLSSAGLITMGAKKVPFIKFLVGSAIISLLIEIPVILLGYYSGIAINSFFKVQQLYNKIAILIVLIIITLFIFKKIKRYISKKLQTN